MGKAPILEIDLLAHTSRIKTRVGMHYFNRANAFTLVELLSITVIISILIALLLTAYSSVTRLAGRTGCMSNLRNIGVAINSYMADHDGYYPGPINGTQGVGASSGLLGYVLRDYVGAPNLKIQQPAPSIFVCPAWRKLYPNAKYGDGLVVYMTNHVITVGQVTYDPWGAAGSAKYPTPIRHVTLAALEGQPDYSWSPTKAAHGVFSLSGTWAITDLDYPFCSPPYMAGNTWSPPPTSKPVHGAARNVLFFDWHVESVSARYAADGQLSLDIP